MYNGYYDHGLCHCWSDEEFKDMSKIRIKSEAMENGRDTNLRPKKLQIIKRSRYVFITYVDKHNMNIILI